MWPVRAMKDGTMVMCQDDVWTTKYRLQERGHYCHRCNETGSERKGQEKALSGLESQ